MSNSSSSSARDQVLRLLALVPLLHQYGEVGLGQAARALGVSETQVVRDLKVLWMCGLPGGLPDDLIDVDLDALETDSHLGLIRVSNADYLARPVRLTPQEASALVLALRAVRASVEPASQEVIDRALAKLEAAVSGGDAMHSVSRNEESQVSRFARQAEAAIAGGNQLELVYYVPTRDEDTTRVVDPRQVVLRDGVLYLDAWCHLAEDDRLFRLDRVQAMTSRTEPISRPTEERDPAELFALGSGISVTLRLAHEARWVPEYYPMTQVTEDPDGSLLVELVASDERWLDRLLLRLAGSAQVIGPPEVAKRHQKQLAEVLALYEVAD